MDWQYTNDRTVQLQWGFPHSSRCRFLAVLSAHVQTMPSGDATRSGSDAATCVLPTLPACLLALSSKFFQTILSTPAWISFWRCNPHAPGGATRTRDPFPCSSGSAPRTCPGRCLACVQRCLAGKRFSPVLALLHAGVLTVSHTRHDVASPASVSVHSIASIVEPGRGGAHSGTAAYAQSGRVYVSIAIPASDGGLKLFVKLPLAALLLLPSLLAAFSVINGIPRTCCCGATRQHR